MDVQVHYDLFKCIPEDPTDIRNLFITSGTPPDDWVKHATC